MDSGRNLPARDPEDRSDVFGFSHLPPFGGLPSVPIFWRASSNLAACVSAPPKGYRKEAFWWMFRSARIPRRYPGRSLVVSSLLHAGWIALLLNPESAIFRFPSYRLPEAPAVEHQVLYFNKDDLLPLIAPEKTAPEKPEPAPQPPPRPAPVPPRDDQGFHPVQTIVSQPPAPDNRRQTIIQPESPGLLIAAEVRVPNMVYWRTEMLPPAPSLAESRRDLSQINLPNLPAPPVVRPPLPEPPQVENLSAPLTVNPMVTALLNEVPQLPVPARAPIPLPDPPAVAPTVNAGAMMGNLISLSVAPPPPSPEIRLPAGNRAGDFSISPAGSSSEVEAPGSGGSGELADAITPPELSAGDLTGIRVPYLTIFGGNPADVPPPMVVEKPVPLPEPPRAATPAPATPDDLRRLIASTARPALLPDMPRSQPAESAFFGPRRVYTIYINMPNLTSGSGSWILRFAELNGDGGMEDGELSAPLAVRKTDPRYSPAAIRDRVEGTVTLGAQILRDGTVTNIHVLRGLDPRLDASAMAALTNWQFRPAERNGVAVDLEVLVQIPFRLPVF